MSERARENNLWRWLRNAKPADWAMDRIENVAGVGTADVFASARGQSVVIELKSVPRAALIDVELRPEQADFLRRWRRSGALSFVLAQVGAGNYARRFLTPAENVLELLRPLPETRLVQLSIVNPWCGVKEIYAEISNHIAIRRAVGRR